MSIRSIHPFVKTLVLLIVAGGVAPDSAFAEIALIGTATLPGSATDESGLTDDLGPNLPHNLFGGISAITSAGKPGEYWVLPDRGPLDGATPFQTRLQQVELLVNPAKAETVSVRLLGTTLLKSENGMPLLGAANPPAAGSPDRFDPEGIRQSPAGAIYISDEYGPAILQFNSEGRQTGAIEVPAHLKAAHAFESPDDELAANSSGRQPNGGMEGLAISPDGKTLTGIVQKPLIQDMAAVTANKREGLFTRMVSVPVDGGLTREFVYPLESVDTGVSEILAVSETRFLVLERDGKVGKTSKCKKLFLIDTSPATDVAAIDQLPAKVLPENIVPVAKRLWIDLLDSRYGLNRDGQFPAKPEGIEFGPTLPGGLRTLILVIDNDFVVTNPTLWCVFSFANTDLE